MFVHISPGKGSNEFPMYAQVCSVNNTYFEWGVLLFFCKFISAVNVIFHCGLLIFWILLAYSSFGQVQLICCYGTDKIQDQECIKKEMEASICQICLFPGLHRFHCLATVT